MTSCPADRDGYAAAARGSVASDRRSRGVADAVMHAPRTRAAHAEFRARTA
jgi:hypothetical protein